MAEYTIELRHVVETHNIFDFRYDFYDEEKRKKFEDDFIRHFYFREICHPSIDRFKLYLQEKMQTVFPYYNELFKATQIEYDVLDNYKLTETYTRNIEQSGKTSGISSTVGQTFDEQSTTTDQNKTVDTTGNVVDDRLDTTEDTGKSKTVNSENVNAETNNETSGNSNSNGETIEKFLDTPQGAVDLSNPNYLTTLKGTTATNQQTTASTGHEDKTQTTNGTSTTDTEHKGKNTGLTITDTTGKEKTVDAVNGTFTGEQKTTHDNNTRTESMSEQGETYTLTRRGNIGVDTDSQGIEKHLRLQKILKTIERNFFDECEDLFMLVY